MSSVAPHLQFQILGPIECEWQQSSLELGGARQLRLLALLLVHANRTVTHDELLEVLTGEERSAGALRFAMARLCKDLEGCRSEATGHPPLQAVTGGYKLLVGARELDADAFAERVKHGRHALKAGEPIVAAEFLRAALAMWRGPALAEVAGEPFAQTEIWRLEELRLTALEARIDADIQLGRHQELVAELEGLVAAYPARRHFARLLRLAKLLPAEPAAPKPVPPERACLIVRPGHLLQRVVKLDAARQLTLGREPSTDIPMIWDAKVSRLHALLERVGDRWTISDEGLSRNGTFCNDERVRAARPLEDGDVLRIGGTVLLFRDPAHAPGTVTVSTAVA